MSRRALHSTFWRAEATFRQIEVALWLARRRGAAAAAPDAISQACFDLELDTEKNQYETQQTASSSDQRAEDINEALKKLDELGTARGSPRPASARRARRVSSSGWQQEMLQREGRATAAADGAARPERQARRTNRAASRPAVNRAASRPGSQQGGPAGGRSKEALASASQSDSAQRPGEPGQSGQSQSAANARARARPAGRSASARSSPAGARRNAPWRPSDPRNGGRCRARCAAASAKRADCSPGPSRRKPPDRIGSMAREGRSPDRPRRRTKRIASSG